MSLTYATGRTPGPNRTGTIVTVSVLVAFFVLLGIGLMWLAVQNGAAFAPTPTPTPTTGPTATPSPDVRATHVAEDMLTQVAFAATVVGQWTPGASSVLLPGLSAGNGTVTVQLPLVVVPGATLQPAASATPGGGVAAPGLVPTGVYMPSVGNPSAPPPEPFPAPTSPLATPPPFVSPLPPQPPTLIPPGALTPTPPIPTPIPASPTPLPLPPTNTPAPIVGSDLAAFMAIAATAHIGPSNAYTATGSLPSGAGIRVRGRTAAGDWLYGCCLPNTSQSFWVRRAYVTIANNPLPAGAPTGTDANDPRWLLVQPPDPVLIPRPTPTGVPPGDFPLARYDAQNSGRLPFLARAPLQQRWFNTGQAPQSFTSPVAVSGPNVLAASADGQFYSLGIDVGNQRWRQDLRATVQHAPAIQDGLIYLAYGTTAIALQDQGNVAGVLWQNELPQPATSPFNVWLDTLFVGAGDGAEARVVAIRRNQPGERREFNEPNSRVQLPAIGQETLFVGADRLWAVDVNLWLGQEIVWTSSDVFNVSAPPVYASPGVVRLAELYVADAGGTVHALDANTGGRLWAHAFGPQITALAVNQTTLFMVNSTSIRAVSREKGEQRWNVNLAGQVMGGPLVTDERVLIVTNNGGVTFLDAASGIILDSATAIPATVPSGPAASGNWLFIPGNNTVYGYQGAQ